MNPSTETLVFMNDLNTSKDPIDKAVCIGMAIAFDMTTPDQAAETVLRLKDKVSKIPPLRPDLDLIGGIESS